MGSVVNKVDVNTNQVLGSGKLLKELVLQESEVIRVEIPYASNTVILNQNGQPVTVERIMDLYYPTPNVKFMIGSEEIVKLPVVVVLHAGQGTRITVAPQALELAQQGYVVLVPTYRSDRSLVSYCIGWENTVYGMVQDLRAALRHFSKAYDEAMTLPIGSIQALYGLAAAQFAVGLKASGCDANALFFSGFSGGGTAGFHTSLRVNQESFPDYLDDTEPYIVDGLLGPVNISQNGGIDAVGTPYIDGYPYPVGILRGVISRTVGVGSFDIVNYENHPNPVPVCFIHGTCDKALPYLSAQLIGANDLCDAQVTHPDGSQDSIATLFGADPISKAVAAAGVYAEMVTFCGGGHVSNPCVPELISERSFEFIRRMLNNDYEDGFLNEIVYRYHPDNYSNQCCEIDSQYTYIEKCSCDASNEIQVIDLPYITLQIQACQFNNSCGLIDYCNLVGVNDYIQDAKFSDLRMVIDNGQAYLAFHCKSSQLVLIQVFSSDGMRRMEVELYATHGENRLALPATLPKRHLLVASLGGIKSLKFILE